MSERVYFKSPGSSHEPWQVQLVCGKSRVVRRMCFDLRQGADHEIGVFVARNMAFAWLCGYRYGTADSLEPCPDSSMDFADKRHSEAISDGFTEVSIETDGGISMLKAERHVG